MKRLLLLTAAILYGLFPAHRADAQTTATRPNIVFILADDLGYGDLGCYGATDIKTPALDGLARQGARFTSFYSNGPECTPTRTAFLTGRYQQWVGGLECALGTGNVGRYDDAIRLREKDQMGLPASETTISRLLKDVGYSTAISGKWHLGYEPKFFPREHGFDHWFGPLGGGADYFHHTEPEGLPVLYLDGRRVEREGYMTDLLTREAVRFVESRDAKQPFFLYVPYTAPHTPYQGPNDRQDKPLAGDDWNKGTRQTYAEMVERMDHGIGEILAAIERKGFAGNTLVVFTSDNGGAKLARNAPFSGNKGGLFEGGIRVPCIIRWPGKIRPGSVADHVGITMDLPVSFARAAGAIPPQGRSFDGIDLLAEVESGRLPQNRTLFWRARRGEVTWRAVRDGGFKYVSKTDGGKFEEHLFDLQDDTGEKKNLLASREGEAARLKGLLKAWEIEVKPVR